METNFTAITIFTLLFAVSTARISLDPQSNCASQNSNLDVVPIQNTNSRSEETDRVQESENDRITRVNLPPRSDLARFHAINRHFFDEPRIPVRSVDRNHQNPSVIPRTKPKTSLGNDAIVTGRIGDFDAEKFHRQAESKRLRFKRVYEHQQPQQQRHQHHRIFNDNNDAKFVGETVKSVVQQQKEKTREHEASFMKSIRKFLRHTSDF